jgi:hypothetical protein
MPQKITKLAVAILTAAKFTTTLVMIVPSAIATDGFKNCSPKNPHVCAQSGEGGNTATTTDPNLAGNTAFSGSAAGTYVIKNGHFNDTGCT